MLLSLAAVVVGIVVLVWSADRFVDGAVQVARHYNMPTFLIGMVIIGFGTSAPEMIVSAVSALQGNPQIALGNAYGSNITNIALILGITALMKPILVDKNALTREMPILLAVTALAIVQLYDLSVSRFDAILMLFVFAVVMARNIYNGKRSRVAFLENQELIEKKITLGKSVFFLILGLVFLIISSRLLVWGAVSIAHYFGVSDLLIGLTIVAIGTSLPELASSIAAVRKGENDIALGNVLGSNLFNTLAVVGIAGLISPMKADPEILYRDLPIMAFLTLILIPMAFRRQKENRINRISGFILVLCYASYIAFLIVSTYAAKAL